LSIILVKINCKEIKRVSNQIIHMYISDLRRAPCMRIQGAKWSQFGCKLFEIFREDRPLKYMYVRVWDTFILICILQFGSFSEFCSMHLTIVFPNSESFRTNEIVSNVAWSFRNAAFGPCFRQQWSRTLTGSHKQVYTTRSISKCNQVNCQMPFTPL